VPTSAKPTGEVRGPDDGATNYFQEKKKKKSNKKKKTKVERPPLPLEKTIGWGRLVGGGGGGGGGGKGGVEKSWGVKDKGRLTNTGRQGLEKKRDPCGVGL